MVELIYFRSLPIARGTGDPMGGPYTVQLAFSHGAVDRWISTETESMGTLYDSVHRRLLEADFGRSHERESGVCRGQYLADNHGQPETAPATALVQFDRGV